MSESISVCNVSKKYRARTSPFSGFFKKIYSADRSFTALSDVSFVVKSGESVGLIGANGAGKSTLLKMIAGVHRPSNGRITVLGNDPAGKKKEYLKRIGVVFGHKTSLWWDLSARTSFDTFRAVYGTSEKVYEANRDELVRALNLEFVIDKPVRNLSLGERVKCEIALALMHSPELVLLDEPTLGLDIEAKLQIRNYLNFRKVRYGTTLLLTSHDSLDIQSCCERLIVLDKGEVKYDGALSGFDGGDGVIIYHVRDCNSSMLPSASLDGFQTAVVLIESCQVIRIGSGALHVEVNPSMTPLVDTLLRGYQDLEWENTEMTFDEKFVRFINGGSNSTKKKVDEEPL